jgi:hypothetical protein
MYFDEWMVTSTLSHTFLVHTHTHTILIFITHSHTHTYTQVVEGILGSVVGELSCGEHHTAVLTSNPWSHVDPAVIEFVRAEVRCVCVCVRVCVRE